MNKHGRVAQSGFISEVPDMRAGKPTMIPSFYRTMVVSSLNIRGVHVPDFKDADERFYTEMTVLVHQGKILYDEYILEGMDKVWEAFNANFTGKNVGKTIVKV